MARHIKQARIKISTMSESTELFEPEDITGRNAALQLRESQLLAAIINSPKDVQSRLALSDFLVEHDRDRDASIVLRETLVHHPDHPLVTLQLGVLLHAYPAFQEEATALLRRVIALDPAVTAAYRPLAVMLAQNGRLAEAISVLRAWCAAAPLDPTASHLLAAYTAESVPDRAADAFLRQTFDQIAAEFDTYLRGTLKYRAPEALSAHLNSLLPRMAQGSLDILDMGCGTGLCAPLLRPLARRLTGVDISSGMIAKARETCLYDALEEVELTEFLARCNKNIERFDLLFASDTLIYFGRLDWLLAAAHGVLRPGGWLAFTVERLKPDEGEAAPDFMLDTTGRYKHDKHYLESALLNAGFLMPNVIEAELRLQLNRPEIGLVVVARKPD